MHFCDFQVFRSRAFEKQLKAMDLHVFQVPKKTTHELQLRDTGFEGRRRRRRGEGKSVSFLYGLKSQTNRDSEGGHLLGSRRRKICPLRIMSFLGCHAAQHRDRKDVNLSIAFAETRVLHTH